MLTSPALKYCIVCEYSGTVLEATDRSVGISYFGLASVCHEPMCSWLSRSCGCRDGICRHVPQAGSV